MEELPQKKQKFDLKNISEETQQKLAGLTKQQLKDITN
jgi:hypothetical protein